jgi:hypothetical protein
LEEVTVVFTASVHACCRLTIVKGVIEESLLDGSRRRMSINGSMRSAAYPLRKPVVAKGAIHMRQHIDFLQYRLIRESYAIPLLCEYKLMKASFPNVDWKPIDDPLEQNPLVIANEWFVKQVRLQRILRWLCD